VIPKRTYQGWCRTAAGRTAVAAAIAVLAGCSAGGSLNGHPASTLSTGGPAATSSPGGPAATASTGIHGSATASGHGSGQGSTATANQRPRQRPNSVSRVFTVTPIGGPCMKVEAGSASTTFTVERLTFQTVCFIDLNVSEPPTIEVTTPDGTQETPMLAETGATPGEWDWMIHSVPGQGPEASLGEYAFRVTTAASGASGSNTATIASQTTTSASSGISPSIATDSPASEIAISGHFTVIPAASPAVDLSSYRLSAGSQLQIAFSGFPGSSVLYVTVYGPGTSPGTPAIYPLLADLPGLTTDQNGEGVTYWAVPSGTVVGQYPIWFDPPPAGCHNPCISLYITP
jgi:hypothetical protein